jgi:ketosteroid isomerase-like protein
MNLRNTLFLFLLCFSISVWSQKWTISYESRGKFTQLKNQNPFAKFFGEWTLKNNDWSQNWGVGVEQIKIPNHHTVTTGINTKNSLISIIDGPEPNGQIYWSYNPVTKEVNHLSSFGDIRAGRGKGTVDANGNLRLKLFFEGEAENTYRIYTYTWVNDNEYILKSVQYDQQDQPTGLYYGGTFVRIPKEKTNDAIKQEILNHSAEIREAFAQNDLEKIKLLHHPNVEKALGYNDLKKGRQEVIESLKETLDNFTLEFIKNEVESILIQGDVAIEQTAFAIKGTPKNGGDPFIFKGRTMVTYIRYQESPTGWATLREIIQPYTE